MFTQSQAKEIIQHVINAPTIFMEYHDEFRWKLTDGVNNYEITIKDVTSRPQKQPLTILKEEFD